MCGLSISSPGSGKTVALSNYIKKAIDDDFPLVILDAADKHENWSANKLRLFYIKGEVEYNNNKTIFDEVIKADKQSRSKALEYFKKAVEYTIDDSSIYTFAYMIINYPEIYKDDKDLLKYHISIIKERKDHKANKILENGFNKVYGHDIEN